MNVLAILTLCLLGTATFASVSTTDLRFDPHTYANPRGDEPDTQAVGLIKQSFNDNVKDLPWDVSFHFEGEALGRRDVSLDLDRAWMGLPLSNRPSASEFYFGRFHPWDVSDHPDANRPWGLLAQSQPQNRGILLGYGYGADPAIPDPIILGWVGAQYWSDRSHTDIVQWGVAATPFFIPDMGSDVTISPKDPTLVGRFGRRPPGMVDINGNLYPIHFEIDKSRVWQDIILNPQTMAQLQINSAEKDPQFQTWFTALRAPNPNPTFNASDYLIVTGNSVEAYARVSPKYDERIGGTVTERWNITNAFWHPNLFASLEVFDDDHWGYEVGAANDYVNLSLLDEEQFGAYNYTYQTNSASYTNYLAQITATVPVSLFTVYAGVMRHLTQDDLWVRAGLKTKLSRQMNFITGFDVFTGTDSSYFGEWRTNDRLSAVLTWEFGT